jgi:pimeloyl-ACP methyl ester carboxylesterase
MICATVSGRARRKGACLSSSPVSSLSKRAKLSFNFKLPYYAAMLNDRDMLSYLVHRGERIAFHGLPATASSPEVPGIVFCGGFQSDMTGSKAEFLAALARTQGLAYTRFDYSGHGQSSGSVAGGDIERWTEEALAILDQATAGPQILVGSSMGGWIACLVAKARPERVAGLIGIAAAPDYTEDLIWSQLREDQRALLTLRGHIEVPSEYGEQPYLITMAMIEAGRRHFVLRDALDISCPVRLLHGQADRDVPWATSVRLAEVLTGSDVRVTLVKDGQHRFSRESDLAVLKGCVEELVGI